MVKVVMVKVVIKEVVKVETMVLIKVVIPV